MGDYHDTGKFFIDPAWKAIRKAYGELTPAQAYGLLPEDSTLAAKDIDPWLREVPIAQPSRDFGPTLLPIAFCDHGHAERKTFSIQLHKYLAHYDVFAVIACGTASNTKALLEALRPVNVPVLIVVDSTVTALEEEHPNVLRLTPNNELQATSILGRTKELLASDKYKIMGGGRLHLYHQDFDNPYVKDLVQTLRRLTEEQSDRVSPHNLTHAERLRSLKIAQFVIVVGYTDALRTLLKAQPVGGSTVLVSDGCFNAEAVSLIQQYDEKRRCNYFWTHAAFSYAEYAKDAYIAATRVWQRLIKQSASRALVPGRLSLPIDQIKTFLEESMPARYRFNGNENQRGGYVVDEICEDNLPLFTDGMTEQEIE